ncbi:MAG TPA: hypothetical protein VN083_00880, partial [Vicinamibacteria bacterium]|nr:hypothetical protein [Vicinamibacteria bacterium]
PLPPRASISDPPPPAKKGKGPVFWGVTGCCGCLTLLIVIAAIGYGFFQFVQKGAVDAATGEFTEIREGKIDAAYDRLSSSYKARLSREDFETLLNHHPAIRSNKDVAFSEKIIVNDNAHLAGTVTSSTGETEKITIELQKEGGAWKIASFELWGPSAEGPRLWRLPPA